MGEITFSETDGRGRWSMAIEGSDKEAEMTFSRASDSKVLIDHTFVPDEARGRGLATKLAERAVADARAHGWTLIPVCPFFKAVAEAHSDWGDVLPEKKGSDA